ncbi:MAG: DUF5320 domain-containing protein [Tissierellia bacterium]|nr:DUF5320 domain-containing protein [Tissierellia bacterium]
MPRFDATGPRGMGPMTGWRRGYCMPRGYRGRGEGMGYGYGRGIARTTPRSGPWVDYAVGPEDEQRILEEERSFLRARLEEIEEILDDSE